MVLQTYEWIIKCQTYLQQFLELAQTYEEMGHYLLIHQGIKSAQSFELSADLYLKDKVPNYNRVHQLLHLAGQVYQRENDHEHAMVCYRRAIDYAEVYGTIPKDSMTNLPQLEAIQWALFDFN